MNGATIPHKREKVEAVAYAPIHKKERELTKGKKQKRERAHKGEKVTKGINTKGKIKKGISTRRSGSRLDTSRDASAKLQRKHPL